MTAMVKILAGGIAAAALVTAAPAAAQYYPGYGGGNVVGQVLNQVLGGGYGGYGYNGYGPNTQIAAQQCAGAVQQRINGGYSGYGGYGGGYGGGRVLAITHADVHGGGITRIRGVASSGMNAGYGYGYGYGGGYGSQTADLKFRCDVDYRGAIRFLTVDRNYDVNGYSGYSGYSGYNNYDYSQYGYRRY